MIGLDQFYDINIWFIPTLMISTPPWLLQEELHIKMFTDDCNPWKQLRYYQ